MLNKVKITIALLMLAGISFAGTLSGIVVNEDASPLVNAEVFVYGNGHWENPFEASTTTDSTGFYEFTGLEHGVYGIDVTLDEYEIFYGVVEVNGDTTYDIVMTMDSGTEDGFILTGIITDADSNEPIAYADVTLVSHSHGGYNWGMSNENGEYSIENIVEGTYMLFASAYGYYGEYELTITEDTVFDIQLVFNGEEPPEWVEINGFVVDELGEAISSANINLQINNNHWSTFGWTDENGNFAIYVEELPVTIQATKYGFNSVEYTVQDSTENILITLTAIDYNASLSGIVSDLNGNPIANAEVLIFNLSDWHGGGHGGGHNGWDFEETTTTSDENGLYLFDNLQGGEWTISVMADGFYASDEDVFIEEGENTLDFTLELIEGLGSVIGNVYSVEGPLFNAFISAEPIDGNGCGHGFMEFAVSDENGNYELNLSAGDYYIACVTTYIEFYENAETIETATVITVTEDGVVSGIDFEMELAEEGDRTMVGGFVSENDQPISNVELLLFNGNGDEISTTFTNENGYYSFTEVNSGNSYVIVTNEDSQLYTQSEYVSVVNFNTTTMAINENVVSGYKLNGNYPNPFNPSTTISYNIAQNSNVNVSVYDLTGQFIEELVNSNQSEGYNEVVWNASNRSSGVYLVKLTANGFVSVQQIMLVK